jgi:hypothetical protein
MNIRLYEMLRCSPVSLLPLVLALGACAPSGPSNAGYLSGVGNPIHQQVSNGPHHPPPAIYDDVSYWEGDGVPGSPLIRIVKREQKAYFYKGGKLVGIARISTGKEGKDTPPGHFKITEKSKDHRSNIYGVFKSRATGETIDDSVDIREKKVPPGAYFVSAPMPNFLRFNGAIGMHTGYLPGYPASGGCIRMPHHMAEKFFANVELGTPVIVE